jgi:hypothetical protein
MMTETDSVAEVLCLKKVIGEPWFPGLTLKTVLNWDFYCNKCTLYIKILTILTIQT